MKSSYGVHTQAGQMDRSGDPHKDLTAQQSSTSIYFHTVIPLVHSYSLSLCAVFSHVARQAVELCCGVFGPCELDVTSSERCLSGCTAAVSQSIQNWGGSIVLSIYELAQPRNGSMRRSKKWERIYKRERKKKVLEILRNGVCALR